MLSYPMKTKSRVNDTEVLLADLNPGEEATISGIDTNTHGQDRGRIGPLFGRSSWGFSDPSRLQKMFYGKRVFAH